MTNQKLLDKKKTSELFEGVNSSLHKSFVEAVERDKNKTKELDWTDIVKNIFFANGVKCDSEQFLIEDINNLIKEIQEETRKEVVDECKQKMAQSNEWWNKKLLSITNKETKK